MDLDKPPAGGATVMATPAAPYPPAIEQPTAPRPPAPHYPPPTGAYRPAPMTPAGEVTWATLAHLTWLVGAVLGGLTFLGPLVGWFVLKDRGPYVRHHAGEALNAHLSYLIYTLLLGAATGLFTIITFGIGSPTLLAPGAVALVGAVLSIVAAASASRGTWYRYPLVIRFVS